MLVRLVCRACAAPQPPDRRAGDLCPACGGEPRRETRCAWCLAWAPEGKYCRDCGAEMPPPEQFGAARTLKAGGVDRFAIAARLREMPADYVADLGRRFEARWAGPREVLERLAHAAAYLGDGEEPAALLESATVRLLGTLPLEGPVPAPPPARGVLPPPAARDPLRLRGPERDAAVEALRSLRSGCEDPDLGAAVGLALLRLCALDPPAVAGVAAALASPSSTGSTGGSTGLSGTAALLASRLWVLPGRFPRESVWTDYGLSQWMSGQARGIADRLRALAAGPAGQDPRRVEAAAAGLLAMGDRAAETRRAAEGALESPHPETRLVAALALAKRSEELPPRAASVLRDAVGSLGPAAALAAARALLPEDGRPVPPEVTDRVRSAMRDPDPLVALEAIRVATGPKPVPAPFVRDLFDLLEDNIAPEIRAAAAAGLDQTADPPEEVLRRLVELANPAVPEDISGRAVHSLRRHAPGRPWILAPILRLYRRCEGDLRSAVMYAVEGWAQEGVLPPALLLEEIGREPDAERRAALVHLGRALVSKSRDPSLYESAFRLFLRDPDPRCRDGAIWIMRDDWKERRDRAGSDGPRPDSEPIGADLAGRVAGDPSAFWRDVRALLSSGAARDCATGEHLEWIAGTAGPDLLAALASRPAEAEALAAALLSAAGDGEVRTYPRAEFVKLSGRLAEAVPAVAPAVRDGLVRLGGTDPPYDIRHWLDRLLAKA
ncbi:MAG: hypothetical protein L0216_07130 [Planctomycetales bacterium]|nr:hypothetical protein [Planctomycetales bacterium]